MSLYVHHLNAVDELSGLHAVSPDVLHGRGSNGARDAGQVLQSAQALLHAPVHEVAPVLSGTGYGESSAGVLLVHGAAEYVGTEHQAVVVTEEEQVAAGADVQPFVVAEYFGAHELEQRIGRVVACEIPGLGGNAEGGERGEVFVLFYHSMEARR